MRKALLIPVFIILSCWCALSQEQPKALLKCIAEYDCADTVILDGWHVTNQDGRQYHRQSDGYFHLDFNSAYSIELVFFRDGYRWDSPVETFLTGSPTPTPGNETFEADTLLPHRFGIYALNRFIAPDGSKVYMDCMGLCNGYRIARYDNGNMRMEGHFNNGHPTGSVVYYNEDLTIHHIDRYSRKGKYKKTILGEYTDCCGPRANVRRALENVRRN